MRAAPTSAAQHPSTSETTQPNRPGSVPAEEEEEYFADDPEVIFRREWSKLDTVPLTEPVPLRVSVLLALFIASFFAGGLLVALTSPSVTITLTPVTKTLTATMPLALPTRSLAAVTLTQTQTAPTSGHGHQDASEATGTLLFYNGSATPQYVAGGSIFTGGDSVQVMIDHSATIPAANLPAIGSLAVSAHALHAGAQGNIAAFDVNLALSPDLKVRNEAPFTNGREARDFPVVARADLNSVTRALQTALATAMPQAFNMPPGEGVTPTSCHWHSSADHRVGEEATTLTVTATETCQGISYRQNDLQEQAGALFSKQTRPDRQYTLLHTSAPQVVSVTPLTVQMSGTWVYLLSPDYQQFLAEQIAGDTPAQAQQYLLATGVITGARVPAQLPKDPGHIHFLALIGA